MNGHDGHRERMRRRFLDHGLDNFDDHNVLELLLFFALPRRDTNALAHRLMQRFGSLDGVFDAPAEELQAVEGMGESAVTLIRLVPAVGRRYMMRRGQPGRILRDTEAAGRYLVPRFLGERDEIVLLLCLDAKMKLLACRELGRGDVRHTGLNLRKLAEAALSHNAAAVILAHNHVSGVALPSPEDRESTARAWQLLQTLNVELIDHIIVGGDDFVSLKDDGFFDRLKAEG